MEYNPEKHGKIHLKAQWRGACPKCGWILEANDVCVGEGIPPAIIECPRCLMEGKWSAVRIVRT